MQTALTCEYAERAAIIDAMESSSSLVAQTHGLARDRVAAQFAKAIEEAHAPTNLIAFIVLAMPRITITRFRLYASTCRLISVFTCSNFLVLEAISL